MIGITEGRGHILMIINIGILEGRDITDIDLDLDLETIKITEGVKKTLK